jgi:uncharacterized protein YutE (UPF0331/DUF86 family)
LTFLEEEIQDYGKFRSLTRGAYLGDRNLRRNVERWAENIINSCVDAAKLILTLEGIPLPDSYKEIVASVSAAPPMDTVDAQSLARWVHFRNLLVHEYLDLRWNSLQRFITETEELYTGFLAKAKTYLEQRISEGEPGGGL